MNMNMDMNFTRCACQGTGTITYSRRSGDHGSCAYHKFHQGVMDGDKCVILKCERQNGRVSIFYIHPDQLEKAQKEARFLKDAGYSVTLKWGHKPVPVVAVGDDFPF